MSWVPPAFSGCVKTGMADGGLSCPKRHIAVNQRQFLAVDRAGKLPHKSPMSRIKALMAASAAALLSACTMGAVNLLVPRTGYEVHRDLSYGADPRQTLDVYVPAGAKGPLPVLLFFYGGGWQGGSRTDYRAFG